MVSSMVLLNGVCLVAPKSFSSEFGDRGQKKRTLLPAFSHLTWCVPYRPRFLFFRQAFAFDDIVSDMKKSIARALVQFYPLAGRLFVSEDGRMELDCNGAGIEFIEASADIVLDEDEFDFSIDLLNQLAQTPGHDNLKWPWPSDAPLLFVQVTKFMYGGMCISLRYNHQVMDGTSFWHFVKSWAETSRGENISLSPQIVHQPLLITAPPPITNIPHFMKCFKREDLLSPHVATSQMVTRRFTFHKGMIQQLKQQNRGGLSTFQLLSAHIWCKVTESRNLADDETTTLLFAISCRGRVRPFSKAYFGVAAPLIAASTTAAALKTGSTANAALLVKKAIEEFTEERASSLCRLIEQYVGDTEHTIFPHVRAGKDLLIGSSFNFPVYEEFGWGTPVGMTMMQSPEEGRLYYFPGRDKGSVDVFITLPSDVVPSLETNATFASRTDL